MVSDMISKISCGSEGICVVIENPEKLNITPTFKNNLESIGNHLLNDFTILLLVRYIPRF